VSAPVPNPAPQPAAQVEPADKKAKKAKAPKAPRPPKVKRPMGIAPLLLLFALLLAGAAVAVLYYPIPGLTAKAPEQPAAEEKKAQAPASAPDTAAADLAKREADLAAREEALKAKEAEVARLMRELGVTETGNAALKRAANMYTNMAPYKAAPLMAQLDDDTAVQILRLMTDEEAAAILSSMDPDRGARIMKALATPPVTNPSGG
jgi:flagellar motility protein MotE (MotC chaperone)